MSDDGRVNGMGDAEPMGVGGVPAAPARDSRYWMVQVTLLVCWLLWLWVLWPLGYWRIIAAWLLTLIIGGCAVENSRYRKGRN